MKNNEVESGNLKAGFGAAPLLGHACVVLAWLMKWPVKYALQGVCIINVVSLIYLNLCPDDPLNLPALKLHLLVLNAYAFGSVLSQVLKYVVRRNAGGDRKDDGYQEEHGDGRCAVTAESGPKRSLNAYAIGWRDARRSSEYLCIKLKQVYADFVRHGWMGAKWPNDQAQRPPPETPVRLQQSLPNYPNRPTEKRGGG